MLATQPDESNEDTPEDTPYEQAGASTLGSSRVAVEAG